MGGRKVQKERLPEKPQQRLPEKPQQRHRVGMLWQHNMRKQQVPHMPQRKRTRRKVPRQMPPGNPQQRHRIAMPLEQPMRKQRIPHMRQRKRWRRRVQRRKLPGRLLRNVRGQSKLQKWLLTVGISQSTPKKTESRMIGRCPSKDTKQRSRMISEKARRKQTRRQTVRIERGMHLLQMKLREKPSKRRRRSQRM